MRILEVTTHITIEGDRRFTRNRTGFGYMVYDIAKYIAKKEEVDLFCSTIMNDGVKRDNLRILKWNWRLFWRSFKLCNLIEGFRFLRKYPVSGVYPKFRILFFNLLSGYLVKLIKNYDVVHVHGCSPLTEVVITVCKQQEIKCLVTLHGLNSIGNKINLPASLKQYERDFLKQSVVENRHLSFISSGDRDKATILVGIKCIPKHWYVIPNGCNVNKSTENINIRLKYKIAKSDFLFVYVGNISKNKNQIEVAKAFTFLPKDVQNRLKVLFVGNEADQGELLNFISEHNLNSMLILAGFVPKDIIHNYYYSADATILVSLQEGFGLSIIEGFVYGKPNVTYADLSSLPDVYDKGAMIVVAERNPKMLAKAMIEASQRVWDNEMIAEYSNRFSLEEMSNRYLNILNTI